MTDRAWSAGRLAVATGLVGVNVWVGQSAFVPVLLDSRGVEYMFVSAPFRALVLDLFATAALLLLIQWLLWRRGAGGRFFSGDNTAHVRVLGWTALTLLPLANLVLPGALPPPVNYVLFDLRWVLWLVVSAAFVWRIRRLYAARLSSARPSQNLAMLVIAALATAVAIVSTPRLRFSEALHGDEPKYLRFCENFYQGLGFDIAAKQPLDAPGAAEPRVMRNVRGFIDAVREEVRLLANDGAWWAGLPADAPLRAAEPSGLIFSGKHPGTVYQLHNPGLSFLLFPSYYVDRRWTGTGVGYENEFPAQLPAVGAMLLVLYATYGLAVYGLLRGSDAPPATARGLAAMAMLTLPVSAFAFQIYPEVAAGIIICLLVRRLIVDTEWRFPGSLAWGLLAGFLPWLHVRFGLVSVVVLCWAIVDTRRPWRSRLAALAGGALGLMALALYVYRLTGSLLPSSTYGADAPVTLTRAGHGLPGFLFDRTYGLLAHAPIYLVSLPGVVSLTRRRRDVAGSAILLIAAIAVPAAGHGYWAAGGTPGRYIVAAMPLLMLFLAESIRRWSGRRIFWGVFAALAAVSLETAIRYNLSHQKEIGPIVARAFAGWRLNLTFPALGTGWTLDAVDLCLLVAWCLATSLALALPLVVRPERRTSESVAQEGWGLHPGRLAGGLALIAALGMVTAALTGRGRSVEHFVTPREAREEALATLATQSACVICYSSVRGVVEPASALGNEPAFIDLRVEPASPLSGEIVVIRARPRSTTYEYLFGNLLLDFGDGSAASFRRHFGDVEVEHIYTQRATYRVRAVFAARSDRMIEADLTLKVD